MQELLTLSRQTFHFWNAWMKQRSIWCSSTWTASFSPYSNLPLATFFCSMIWTSRTKVCSITARSSPANMYSQMPTLTTLSSSKLYWRSWIKFWSYAMPLFPISVKCALFLTVSAPFLSKMRPMSKDNHLPIITWISLVDYQHVKAINPRPYIGTL